tara:strand:- start:80 stop:502 length:423 start_codon:yes stop_codon:yes gene_type:complete
MKKRRQLLGLSQAYVTAMLPDATDSNPNAVGRIETGEVSMTDTRAVFIAQVLRVPIAWLYGLEEWADVPENEDPYLDREAMYEQFLGVRRIKQLTAEIDKADIDTRRELLELMIKSEIRNKGVDHGATTTINRRRTQEAR